MQASFDTSQVSRAWTSSFRQLLLVDQASVPYMFVLGPNGLFGLWCTVKYSVPEGVFHPLLCYRLGGLRPILCTNILKDEGICFITFFSFDTISLIIV